MKEGKGFLMELEDRLKVLEGEMKILKNEIQSMLLDIQEQVLSHYYPALRAEESSPPEGVVQSLESIRSERRKKSPPKETSTLPKAKKVTLEEIRAAQKETPVPPEEQAPSQSEEEAEEETDQATITELAEWVGDSVEKIGGERTSKLIEKYVKGGHISSDVKDILLGLISLSDDGSTPEKVGVTETLNVLLRLNEVLGLKSESDIAMTLSLIEEENLG